MRLTEAYRTAILTVTGMVVMLALWAVTAQHGGWIVARGLELVSVFASLAWLFTFGRNVGRLPASVGVLSDWTYAVYLLHPFFVYLVADVFVPTTGITVAGTWPIQWLAGLGGAVTATALLRRTLGQRSRDLIGA